MRLIFPRLGPLATLVLPLTLSTLSFGVEQGAPPASPSPIPRASRQLLLVRSADWSTTSGLLQRYERTRESRWVPVGEPLRVNLGKRGMAWGRGLQAAQAGPTKREGDLRTPAGVFLLGTLFGYGEQAPAKASPHFGYVQIRASTACVEDPKSPAYNQIVPTSPKGGMLRADGVFRLGFVIQQNAPEVVPGAGSCVFFHVERGPSLATSGCTSTSLADLERIVTWLEPELEPVLVELPEAEFQRHRQDWGLPQEAPAAASTGVGG